MMAISNDYMMSAEEFDAFLAADAPSDSALLMLWKNGHTAKKRSANKKAKISAKSPKPTSISSVDESNHDDTDVRLPVQRALPLEARLQSAARDITTFGQNDIFRAYPITVSNEFPTLLTRLPIFRPSRRLTQQKIQDLDNAVSFETPYGVGRRHGPPLTIKDEDTLIALLKLRNTGLTGPDSHLPANVRDIHRSKNGQTTVHRVTCTITQINELLGLSESGDNYKTTLDSLKRLNACKIEISRKIGDGGTEIGTFDLLKMQMRVYESHGLIDAIFPPQMANWLQSSYTFIDWEIRKNLTPLGKAVHRYYSGQRSEFKISLVKLAKTVGYDGRPDRFRKTFEKPLRDLTDIAWLEFWEITGNGRTEPFIVHTRRSKPDKK